MNKINFKSKKLITAVLLIVPLFSFAAEFRTSERPTLQVNQTVNDDLYMAGGNVTSSGSVVGDLVAGGGSVLVNGPVSGDIMAGGGTVTVLGKVEDDVRAGGGNIIIQGEVVGDVVAGGGQIQLSGPRIGGDVIVGGEEIYINAPIAGNVEAYGGRVILGPRANISGSFEYTARKEATLEEGAVVQGETKFNKRVDRRIHGGFAMAGFLSLWFFGKFLMLLVGSLVLMVALRRFTRELVHKATANIPLEIGRGFLFLVATPVASVILLFTILGIPFGILGLITFVATIIFACLSAPIVLGSIVHRWIYKPEGYQISWKTVLLGAVIFSLLGVIPFLGWIVQFATVLLVIGAMVNIKWGLLKEWR